MSDTILGIARASAHAKFLQDFYGFTSVVKTWNAQVIQNYVPWIASDVLLIEDYSGERGIIIGIVDQDTRKLTATGSANLYKKNSLWYRSVTSSEIAQIAITPQVVYNYEFFPDKIFSNFYMRNFQINSYNSGSIIDMVLTISPNYFPELQNTPWSEVPQDELFGYTITF